MSQKIIMFSSITYALKAKDTLKRHGIRAVVVKTPKNLSSCGCGHSLKINGNIDRAFDIIQAAGIKTNGIGTI